MDSRGKTFFRTKFFNKLEIYETFLPATKQVPIHSLLPSQTIVLYFTRTVKPGGLFAIMIYPFLDNQNKYNARCNDFDYVLQGYAKTQVFANNPKNRQDIQNSHKHTDILIFYIKLMQIGGYLVSLFGLIRPLQIAVKQKVSGQSLYEKGEMSY